MLINFTLVPLEEILPWGPDERPRLSWFGLTDGFYWIEAGESSLFEYSVHAQAAGASRFCNYYVVRLYEDLMEMLPHVLEPVPPRVASYLSADNASAWRVAFKRWCARNEDIVDPDTFWDIVDAVTKWSGKRHLDTGYLSPSTNIVMWSEAENVCFEWDNRADLFEGQPAWTALQGRYQLPRNAFVAEIQSFHARLMAQMEKRVEKVLAGALSPRIEIDMQGLAREHAERCLTLEKSLARPQQTDWWATEKYINQILDAEPASPA